MTDNTLFSANPTDFQDAGEYKDALWREVCEGIPEDPSFKADLELLIEYIDMKVEDLEERANYIAKAKSWDIYTLTHFMNEHREHMQAEIIALFPNKHQHKQPEPVVDKTESKQVDVDNSFGEDEHVDNNEYTIVENWLLEHPDPRIKGEEIAIYTLLDYHAHFPKRTCWVSIVGLSERTGWARPKVRQAINNLMAVSAVTRNKLEKQNSRPLWTLPHRHEGKAKKRQKRG